MKMKFEKMHGCGNDYVYVNGFDYNFTREQKEKLAIKVSDRHFGIGSDGLIFINPSEIADFEMEMYNADGSRAEMCGNGIRCVAKYVYDHGMINKEQYLIESMGKIKVISVKTENHLVTEVTVDMGEPILSSDLIPVLSDTEQFVDVSVDVNGEKINMTAVSMGNPHTVMFYNPDKVLEVGPFVEIHPLFPRKVNAEFVEVIDKNNVRMRVWERGTGETLACGTGCCATTVACVLNGKTDRCVNVHVLGGIVKVEWNSEDNHIYMTGPAETVFCGEIEV